jgi:hypothetical protein
MKLTSGQLLCPLMVKRPAATFWDLHFGHSVMSEDFLPSEMTRQSQNEKQRPDDGGQYVRDFSRDMFAPEEADKEADGDDKGIDDPNDSGTGGIQEMLLVFHEPKSQGEEDGEDGQQSGELLRFRGRGFSQALAGKDTKNDAENAHNPGRISRYLAKNV